MTVCAVLNCLALKYNSDKLYFHSYIPFYEELFSTIRESVRSVLEIGIGYEHLMAPLVPQYTHGSSLRMWEEYFPHAEIYSCDIRPETLINEGRIHSIAADQSSLIDLANLSVLMRDLPDIIIDDGSHQTEHQIFTARYFLPRMKPGSLYVIEDVQESEKVAAVTHGTIHQFPKRNDDCLVVIRL